MSRHVFALPDLGEGLVEAVLVEWLVAAGDRVEENAPLAEVETTKATVVLPSPVSGTVAELHAEAGATVAVGAPLVSFEVGEQAGIIGTVPSRERPARKVRLRPPGADG